jgi:hypothetical protein
MLIEKAFKKTPLMYIYFVALAATLLSAFPCWAIGDVGIVVERAQAKEGEKIEQCKYCGKFINVVSIHSDAEKIVKEKLQRALTERGVGYRDGKEKQPYINVLIYRFQERRGGNLGVEKPASVGLHMHLMEGNVVGRTFVFDEDQQSLSQNILGIGKFVRRGAKWITVDKLAEEGINAGVDYLIEVLE